MRQAMATLCRQLHDPEGRNAIFRWSIAALQRTGFEALLVFHYTLTAINELREPLHDEVLATVFRIEGDRMTPVEDAVPADSCCTASSIRSSRAVRQDEWIRTLPWPLVPAQGRTGRVPPSAGEPRCARSSMAGPSAALEAGTAMRPRRATATGSRNCRTAAGNRNLPSWPRNCLRQQAEAMQPTLFEEIQEEAKLRVQEIEEQMTRLAAGRGADP